jgi:tRNA uridine 5-carboxymethylaminomethyl modification enzyme
VGLVDDARWDAFCARRDRFERNRRVLDATLVRAACGDRVPASRLLRQPEVRLEQLIASGSVEIDVDEASSAFDIASLETSVKYAGYLRRQESEIQRASRDERRRIPANFPFGRVPGLSREVVERLIQIRPDTLGHALRVPGVTPAAVAVLSAYLSRGGGSAALFTS